MTLPAELQVGRRAARLRSDAVGATRQRPSEMDGC